MVRSEIIQTLKKFKKQHGDEYGILSLGIFGSVARDQAKKDSDLDVVVKMKTPDPYIIVHIKEDIEDKLKVSVDIVQVRDKMNPFLKKQIEKEAVYV